MTCGRCAGDAREMRGRCAGITPNQARAEYDRRLAQSTVVARASETHEVKR
jgi:hypothetical protein